MLQRLLVPQFGIEPNSPPYESGASPQCFKGSENKQIDATSAEHPQGRQLHEAASNFTWTFTMKIEPDAPSQAHRQADRIIRLARGLDLRLKPAGRLSFLPVLAGSEALPP